MKVADDGTECWEAFQGRPPQVGDQVTYFATSCGRWLRAEVVLTPKAPRTENLKKVVPVWPVGPTVCVLAFKGVGVDQVVQPVALDDSARWAFVGDPVPRTRAGRPVRRPRQV